MEELFQKAILGGHLKQLLSRPHLIFGFYKPVCVMVTSVLLTLSHQAGLIIACYERGEASQQVLSNAFSLEVGVVN